MNVTALTLTEGTVRVRAYLFFLAYFFVLTTQCVFAQTPQTPEVQVASTTPSAVTQDSYPRENLPTWAIADC
jgi:hypothetical protein